MKIKIKKIKINRGNINLKSIGSKIVRAPQALVRMVRSIKMEDIKEALSFDWRTYRTLIAKELKAYAVNPATYIILVVFLLAGYLFLFSDFFLIGQASLSGYFDVLPWLVLFLIPALTMNLFSAERRDGTLEYLLTQPITTWQLIVSKYLSVIIFGALALLLMVPLAIAINFYGDVDFGVFGGQILAGMFLVAGIAGIGTLASMLLKNPIAAFLSTVLVSFVWLILGADIVTRGIPVGLISTLENISLLSHFNAISRGVIDLRELLFILAVAVIFLTATYVVLQYMRYPRLDPMIRKSTVRLIGVVLFAVLVAYAGQLIPGRLDLTEKGLYTISNATKSVLDKLEGDVEVIVYSSENLPAQFQPVLREIKYLLREYSGMSPRVKVTYNYVSTDSASVNAAVGEGLQQTQFSVYGQGDVQFITGFLGVVIKSGEEKEVLSFIESTKDLEYSLTSKIYQLTTIDKPVVAFLGAKTKYTETSGYSTFVEQLASQFTVTSYDFSTELTPESIKLLVIGGTTEALSDEEKQTILSYYNSGGNILALVNATNVTASTYLAATKNETALSDLFSAYGVTVNPDIIYDLASSETVQTQNGYYLSYIAYPFWILAAPGSTDSSMTKDIETVLLTWASSITTSDSSISNVEVSPLLTTSKYAGSEPESTYNIQLDRDYPEDESELSTYTVATEIKLLNDDQSTKSRAVVIGNTELFNDQFATYKQNGGFALQLVENLAQAASLSEIKIKDRSAASLVFTSTVDESVIKYIVPALSVIAVILGGTLIILQRRRVSKRVYSN